MRPDSYEAYLARKEKREREQRIWEGILELVRQTLPPRTACCPVCEGEGRITIAPDR
jgi:transposase